MASNRPFPHPRTASSHTGPVPGSSGHDGYQGYEGFQGYEGHGGRRSRGSHDGYGSHEAYGHEAYGHDGYGPGGHGHAGTTAPVPPAARVPAQDTGSWDTGSWDTGAWQTGTWETGSWAMGTWDTGSTGTYTRPAGYAEPAVHQRASAPAPQGPGRPAPDRVPARSAHPAWTGPEDTLTDDATADAAFAAFMASGDTPGAPAATRPADHDQDRTDDARAHPDGARAHADDEWAADAPMDDDETDADLEWNPTADSVRPVRGRHRVMKQRGGLARSSTVLGVGVIAAVGAGGIATAQDGRPPVHISVPDLSSVGAKLPQASSIPVVGHLLADAEHAVGGPDGSATPLTGAGVSADDARNGTTDAGEALRERILQQAEQQKDQAAAALEQAAEDAAAQAAQQQAEAEKAAAEKKAAEAKKKAEAAAKAKAEAERLAKLAKSYTLPVVSYTLTSLFGDAGSMWSSGYHTGLDFAAPTGTPLKAVHTATVKEAGWSGSYGYRTVLELDDGTELWYCHQSSINVSVGQKVTTGDVIGRVGATGNVTGPHLHLEVHPNGGSAVDPMAWLQKEGLNP